MKKNSKLDAKPVQRKNVRLETQGERESKSLSKTEKASSSSKKSKEVLVHVDELAAVKLEIKKQAIKEGFSLARLALCCGVLVCLTSLLLSKDPNLLLEVLKFIGGGGIGYGIGKFFPK